MTLIELQIAIAYTQSPQQTVRAEDSPKWGLQNQSEYWSSLERMTGRGLLHRSGYAGTWDHYSASEKLMRSVRQLLEREL